MRIDPELLAWQADLASQGRARAALEGRWADWRQSTPVLRVTEDLALYGTGQPLEACPALAALFIVADAAADLIEPLMTTLVDALWDHSLGQVPIPFQCSDGSAVLQLVRTGNAALSLAVHEPRGAVEPVASVCFADCELHEIVLAGSGAVQRYILTGGCGQAPAIASVRERVGPASALHLAGFGETRTIAAVEGRLAMLRLSRIPNQPKPTCEHRLSDGALIRCTSGDRRESQHELMMALLGRMGRSDAAPVFAHLTRSGSDHFRWQALRECLALDTEVGFAALGRLAATRQGSLSRAAKALRRRLLETYPELAVLDGVPCPA